MKKLTKPVEVKDLIAILSKVNPHSELMLIGPDNEPWLLDYIILDHNHSMVYFTTDKPLECYEETCEIIH